MVPMQKTGEFRNLSKLEGIGTVLGISNQAPPVFVHGWCCWGQQELFEILYFLRRAYVFFGFRYKKKYPAIQNLRWCYQKSRKFSYEVIILRMMLLTVDLVLFSWWLFNGLYMVNHHQRSPFCDHLTLKQIPSWWCDEFENDTPKKTNMTMENQPFL